MNSWRPSRESRRTRSEGGSFLSCPYKDGSATPFCCLALACFLLSLQAEKVQPGAERSGATQLSWVMAGAPGREGLGAVNSHTLCLYEEFLF